MKLYKSGRTVNPMKLRAEDLDIHDIAHNLSMICRFAGSFPFHYSVAQHSLLVCEQMRFNGFSKEACLAGLLHDAAEYLFNDLISSIKHDPALAEYRRCEHETSRLILTHFNVDPDLLVMVKPYDTAVYLQEERARIGLASAIVPMQPFQTFQLFLDTFYQLYQPGPSLLLPRTPLFSFSPYSLG